MIHRSIILTPLLSLLLSACGGGGSSSGGGGGGDSQQQRDLTFCIAVQETAGTGSFGNSTTYTFTNQCGETVNFSAAFGSSIDSVSLLPNGVYEDSVFTGPLGLTHIACRPPSTGINTATSVPVVILGCS